MAPVSARGCREAACVDAVRRRRRRSPGRPRRERRGVLRRRRLAGAARRAANSEHVAGGEQWARMRTVERTSEEGEGRRVGWEKEKERERGKIDG
jgi:hypothetical protein